MRPDGKESSTVTAARYDGEATQLFVRRCRDMDEWDLYLETRGPRGVGRPRSSEVLLVPALVGTFASLDEQYIASAEAGDDCIEFPSGSPSNSPAADFRRQREPECSVYTGFWGIEGIRRVCAGKRDSRIAFETPLVNGWTRAAHVLPSGQVVFRLGSQIVMADFDARRIALLARGLGPVVVPSNSSPSRVMPQ